MSTTLSIPGVDRDALIDAIQACAVQTIGAWVIPPGPAADAAIAYIAAHHECDQPLVNPAIENGWLVERVDEHTCGGSSNEWPYAHEPGCGSIPVLNLSGLDGWQECDREHDEWVEVDGGTWGGLPVGARRRLEWLSGDLATARRFVHRDDLPDPDPDADLVERMAKAIHARDCGCDGLDECVEPESYRAMARAALAVVREEER